MSRSNDIELYETQELIDELMRRTTFLGIVIHARDEFRGTWESGERAFRVQHNQNLAVEEVGRLLSLVGEHLDRPCA